MEYPTEWGGAGRINGNDLNERGSAAAANLAAAGYVVTQGFEPGDLSLIQDIANQSGVREFCPRDAAERFVDKQAAEQWLGKGRALFVLRSESDDGTIAGYGWTGPEKVPELPSCDTTFAVRLSEEHAGRGLGAPFSAVIAAGSAALYGIEKLGLETWASNYAAFRTYRKVGAYIVNTRLGERTTERYLSTMYPDGVRPDTRDFMRFPDELLSK